MVCVTCNKSDHSETAKYCNNCGTDLYKPRLCTCGRADHELDAYYCIYCGEILPVENMTRNIFGV